MPYLPVRLDATGIPCPSTSVSPVSWLWVTRSAGSSSRALVSAAERRTSSFRSVEATAVASTGSGAASDTICAGADLPLPSVMPVRAPSSLPSPAVSPAPTGSRLVACWPMTRKMPATRPAGPFGPTSSAPSATVPASTREMDSLPPWVVCSVFRTCTTASPVSATFRRARVSAMPGDSWRMALSRRPTPWPISAEPISTGQIAPARISLTRSPNTWSRGGSISERSCSIRPSS